MGVLIDFFIFLSYYCIVVVFGVYDEGQIYLFGVVNVLGFFCGCFCLSKDWEEDCGKNCNDGNDDEKFD